MFFRRRLDWQDIFEAPRDRKQEQTRVDGGRSVDTTLGFRARTYFPFLWQYLVLFIAPIDRQDDADTRET